METAQIRTILIGGDEAQRQHIQHSLGRASQGTVLFVEPPTPAIQVFSQVPDTVDCVVLVASAEFASDGLGQILETAPAGLGLVAILPQPEPEIINRAVEHVVIVAAQAATPAYLYRAIRQSVMLSKSAARSPNSLFGDVHASITALRRASDVHQVFSLIAQACQRMLGAVGLVIAMSSEKDHALRVVHADGTVPAVLRSWEASARQQATPLSDAMQRGEIVELMSPQEISERYADLAMPSAQPLQALVCAPFAVTTTQFGAIGMSFEQSPDFSHDERQFLQILCSQMAETLARIHHAERADQAQKSAQRAVLDREAFLSTAAHEIRTPLTLILGQAQLVQRRLEPSNPQHQQSEKSLDVIVTQTQRLSRLMTSMVSVFQLEDGSLELKHMPLDLNELAASVVRELQHTVLTHAVTFAPAPGPAIVIGDPIYLEQTLHHLVQNGVRFSEPDTEIHVAVKLHESNVQLIVRDQGNGIPVKDVAELFQRFGRVHGETPQHRRGLGIGLYLVREVVEGHQGSVVVENVVSGGSQFTITLPLAGSKTSA